MEESDRRYRTKKNDRYLVKDTSQPGLEKTRFWQKRVIMNLIMA